MSSKKVEVGFYDKPEDTGGYISWTGTDKWILWEHEDGSIHVFQWGEDGKVVGHGAVLNDQHSEHFEYKYPDNPKRPEGR